MLRQLFTSMKVTEQRAPVNHSRKWNHTDTELRRTRINHEELYLRFLGFVRSIILPSNVSQMFYRAMNVAMQNALKDRLEAAEEKLSPTVLIHWTVVYPRIGLRWVSAELQRYNFESTRITQFTNDGVEAMIWMSFARRTGCWTQSSQRLISSSDFS
jgi:hypothetical protein